MIGDHFARGADTGQLECSAARGNDRQRMRCTVGAQEAFGTEREFLRAAVLLCIERQSLARGLILKLLQNLFCGG
jgi:hypothetical protein